MIDTHVRAETETETEIVLGWQYQLIKNAIGRGCNVRVIDIHSAGVKLESVARITCFCFMLLIGNQLIGLLFPPFFIIVRYYRPPRHAVNLGGLLYMYLYMYIAGIRVQAVPKQETHKNSLVSLAFPMCCIQSLAALAVAVA